MRSALRLSVAAAVLVGAALAVPADAGAPALSVRGNRVVDAKGATVVLRGLHRDGTQGGPSTSPVVVSDDEVSWMTTGHRGSWNAGVVRIPVGAAQWTGACPELSNDPRGYRASIDAEVRSVTRRGAIALVDLHTSTAGCSSIDRHAMPDEVSRAFWGSAAAHYARNPRVAFELYNEPRFVDEATWRDGKASMTDCTPVPPGPVGLPRLQAQLAFAQCEQSSPTYRAVGMQELLDLVTARAPGHLVVVDGRDSARTAPTELLDGPAVYALHPYVCAVPGGACDTPDQARADTALLRSWQGLARRAPVLVTELGWPVYPDSDGTGYVDGRRFYRETLAFLGQQQPAWGFVAFAFDGSAGGGFSLLRDTTSYAPNPTGAVVKAALVRR